MHNSLLWDILIEVIIIFSLDSIWIVDGSMERLFFFPSDFVDFGLNPNQMDISLNDFTNKYTSAWSGRSPRSATELQIHTVGCALEHHIMNIEINTKWLNNSSSDRGG